MKLDFSQTKITPGRSITSYAKIQSLVSVLTRNKQKFQDIKVKGCYLNLGCGENTLADFCNLDYHWRRGVDVCWDVRRGLPFPDAYVGGIFCEHMLEHLELREGLMVLAECRRILRFGGILRIVVPDAELYLLEYRRHVAGELVNIPYFDVDMKIFPFATPLVSINRVFRQHGHRFMWDYETLALALQRAGFPDVYRRSFGVGQDAKLLHDSPSRRVESLYVEAT